MSCTSREIEKFRQDFEEKLLKDLASNYDQVQKCKCAHHDRIANVQENIKHYRRMSNLYKIGLACALLALLILVFFIGIGAGISMTGGRTGGGGCSSGISDYDDDDVAL